jgi:hypothetical protein
MIDDATHGRRVYGAVKTAVSPTHYLDAVS